MKFIWLAVVAAFFAASAARADTTYIYTGTYSSGITVVGPFNLDLTVTDALATGGSLSFIVSGFGTGCTLVSPTTCTITGDPTGFISLSDNLFDNYAFPDIFGSLLVNLTFTGTGPSGGLVANGLDTNLSLGIGPNALAGSLQTDPPACSPDSRNFCTVSAIRVPEPPGLMLMFAGLMALFLLRRKLAR